MPTTATAATRRKKTSRRDDEAPLIPILARKVREIEAKSQRGKLGPTNRVKFQVIAFLVREERARVKADSEITDPARVELLKRLDGVATILAKTAARDTSLIQLLEADQATSPVAKRMRRDWLLESGAELAPEELIIADAAPVQISMVPAAIAERQVTPPSVEARQLANPFLAPDLTPRPAATPRRRLDGWELMGPLYKAFETGAGGAAASMELPPAPEFDHISPKGLEVMVHQSRFLEAVKAGHRSFLLADEPGLGKTAQSVLAASVAGAYPLLVVVPNVVKMNWAREVERWTPQRRATVIQGDGDDIDAFADVFIVNYEILDRHMSWLASIGLRGMVVDEAHFIKNLSSQRSQNVLSLAAQVRERTPGHNPLMLALTGTPLINDVEDFDAIWRFLGWTTGEKPGPELMEKLDATGFTPADKAFYPEARDAVISMGIVRRKKKDVAADLPDKLIADLPVQLDDEFGRSIRQAERELGSGSPLATVASSRREEIAASPPARSTTTSCGWSLRTSSRSRRPLAQAETTSSPWCAVSVRRRLRSQRSTPHSSSARWARSSSSRSTSTSWTRRRRTSPPRASARCRSVETRPPRSGSRRSTTSTATPRSASPSARSPRRASVSTCRPRRTWSSPSCPGRLPSRRRRSTACIGSAKMSRSLHGGSSPRTRSTPRSRS